MSSNNLDAPNKRPLLNQERHKILQGAIFLSYRQLKVVEKKLKLNPVLIQTQLHAFYVEKSQTEVNSAKPTYIALLLCNISRDMVYLKDLFFSSLKPHRYIKGASEITFNSRIILNVADILFSPKIVPADTEKLLFNRGKLHLNYLF